MFLRSGAGGIIFLVMAIAPCAPGSAASGWGPAAFAREARRTAQGCAEKFTADDYVCMYVRCDARLSMALYIAAPGPDVRGPVELEIDGNKFPIQMISAPSSPIPYASRGEFLYDELLTAMKTGKQIRIRGSRLVDGYDIVPLKGAGPAIKRVEAMCK